MCLLCYPNFVHIRDDRCQISLKPVYLLGGIAFNDSEMT
jgi:hypothetical protein